MRSRGKRRPLDGPSRPVPPPHGSPEMLAGMAASRLVVTKEIRRRRQAPVRLHAPKTARGGVATDAEPGQPLPCRRKALGQARRFASIYLGTLRSQGSRKRLWQRGGHRTGGTRPAEPSADDRRPYGGAASRGAPSAGRHAGWRPSASGRAACRTRRWRGGASCPAREGRVGARPGLGVMPPGKTEIFKYPSLSAAYSEMRRILSAKSRPICAIRAMKRPDPLATAKSAGYKPARRPSGAGIGV